MTVANRLLDTDDMERLRKVVFRTFLDLLRFPPLLGIQLVVALVLAGVLVIHLWRARSAGTPQERDSSRAARGKLIALGVAVVLVLVTVLVGRLWQMQLSGGGDGSP
jgi:hypothetical protein